jgi:hypothetical protein
VKVGYRQASYSQSPSSTTLGGLFALGIQKTAHLNRKNRNLATDTPTVVEKAKIASIGGGPQRPSRE